MGVCFIGERGKFGDFVCEFAKLGRLTDEAAQYTSPPTSTGYFVNTEGERLGPHRGLHYYTIGQRPGLGGMQGRWFVARKGVGSGEDVLIVQGG
jgi:tRNA-specific 2-thiouridylase